MPAMSSNGKAKTDTMPLTTFMADQGWIKHIMTTIPRLAEFEM